MFQWNAEKVRFMEDAAVWGDFHARLAAELAPSHIRVNCVAPGVIRTDMLNELAPELLPELAQQTPMGRLGRPEDIAAAVAFLAEPAADFVTGQVLSPNGGFVI